MIALWVEWHIKKHALHVISHHLPMKTHYFKQAISPPAPESQLSEPSVLFAHTQCLHVCFASLQEQTSSASMPPEMVASLPPPQSPAQPRGQLPKLKATRKKDGKRVSNSGCKRKKKHPKDSSGPLKNKSTFSGEAELSPGQAEESLRWEGELEDPQAEEMRLELYRANRRKRYIAHRQALLKDKQVASTQSKGKKALAESEQQVAASLLQLRLK